MVPNAGTQTGVTIYVNTVDPNAEINNDDNTTEWIARMQGSCAFPWDITTSINYEHRSGEAQRRTVILTGGRQIPQITLPAEEFGAEWRLPNINLVDLNVQKTFHVRQGQSATLRLNIFNLLNANTVTRGPCSRGRPSAPSPASCSRGSPRWRSRIGSSGVFRFRVATFLVRGSSCLVRP